jgi:hypothetical protein
MVEKQATMYNDLCLVTYHCDCEESESKTLSVLTDWLQDLTSPELQYLEKKWASLMSYGLTADLLKDVVTNSYFQYFRQLFHNAQNKNGRDNIQ